MGRWASAREDVVRTGVAAMWFVGVALLWVLVLDELGLIPGYALAGALLYLGPRPTLRPEVGWRRARTTEGDAIVGPSQGQWRLRMAGGKAPAWVVGPDGPIPLDAAARALISGWSGQIENGMITVLEPPGTTDADRDAQRERAEGIDRAVAQAAGRPLVILLDDPDPAIVLGLWGALDPSVAAASRGRIAAAAAEIVRGGGGGIDGPAQVVAALTWLGEHGHPGDVAPADVGPSSGTSTSTWWPRRCRGSRGTAPSTRSRR